MKHLPSRHVLAELNRHFPACPVRPRHAVLVRMAHPASLGVAESLALERFLELLRCAQDPAALLSVWNHLSTRETREASDDARRQDAARMRVYRGLWRNLRKADRERVFARSEA